MNLSIPTNNPIDDTRFVLNIDEESDTLYNLTSEDVGRIQAEFEQQWQEGRKLFVTPPGATLNPLSSVKDVFNLKSFLMLASQKERDLVSAILVKPDDAELRSVYADFLEEDGRSLEAKCERETYQMLSCKGK